MAIDILSAFSTEPQPFDYVLPGMLAGTVGALVSPGGAGKSMLALELAITIAGGPDLLGIGSLRQGHVVYLPAEDPEIAIHHRLYALGAYIAPADRELVAERLYIEPLGGHQPNLLDRKWRDYITRVADGARLLILDTLRRFHALNENESGPMAELVSLLEHTAHRTGCSILFLHHTTKSAALAGMGDLQQASRGSSVLVDNVRWQAYLKGMTKEESDRLSIRADGQPIGPENRDFYVQFGVSKQNYGPPFTEKWLCRQEGGVLRPVTVHRATAREKQNGKNSIEKV